MTDHKIKEQTKKHTKKMKAMQAEISDCGFTSDEIIDLGDYILNQMTVKELLGEDTKATNTKPVKRDAPRPTPKPTPKPAKGKGKKGKAKKGKG